MKKKRHFFPKSFFVLAVAVLIAVSACGHVDKPPLTVTQNMVVIPPERFFDCPVLKDLPDPDTLTDVETAQLIVQLYENNMTCYDNSRAAKEFLQKAKQEVESGSTKPNHK